MGWQDLTPEQHMANTTGNWASLSPDQHMATPEVKSQLAELEAESKISMPKAIATKFVQGATSGLSDEAAGLGQVIDDLQAPGEFKLDELGRRLGWDAIKTSYEQGRDKIREQQNLSQTAYPKASMASEVVGGFASPLNKVMPASGLKSGLVQGAISGYGNTDAKDASGIAAATTESAAMGGAIGYGVDKILAPAAKWGAGILDDVKGASNMDGAGSFGTPPPPPPPAGSAMAMASGKAKVRASIDTGSMEIENSGQLFETKQPRSLDELKDVKYANGGTESVAASRLKEIEEFAPELTVKPLKYHYDMLHDPKAMNKFKNEFENLPSDDARAIAVHNIEMIHESGREVKNLVQTISKDEAQSLSDAGTGLIDRIKTIYHETKDTLSPSFRAFRENAQDLTRDETLELAQDIGSKTKIGKLLDVTEPITTDIEKGIAGDVGGKLYLKPFSSKVGVTEKEYGILKQVVDDLNGGATFEEIQKIREYLRNNLDNLNPKSTMELSKVRGVLLDSLEKMGGKRDQGFTEIAKKYAINEKSLESLERIVGKIETLDQTFAANPEKVVSKIFSNPNYVKLVSEYAGQDMVDKMVSSFVTNGIKGAYDSVEGFQPFKLRNWLKSNETFLANYVDPNVVKKLKLYADYGYLGAKFLKDVNPSGTAATLLASLQPKNFLQKIKNSGVKAAVTSQLEGTVLAAVETKQAKDFVNKAMGMPEPPKKPSMMSKIPNLKPEIKNSDIINATIAGVNSSNTEKRWAEKGSKTIMESDSSINQFVINELVKSKKGFNLLVQASDFKKDSAAVKKLIEKIKETDEFKKSKKGF